MSTPPEGGLTRRVDPSGRGDTPGESGKVWFVGAGPGAADLLTLRGARVIAEADVVVWAASLVHSDVLEHARPDAEIVDSAALPLEGVRALYVRAVAEGLVVARVHSGDPALWGAVQEQREICDELGLAHETIPGVSAFSAVAAIVNRELTVPEVAQSVVLTRLEGGKTPMPPGETVRGFAAHGATMALFLSAARSGQLQTELLAGGYAPDTPCVVAYQATWPDELVLHCTVETLEATCKEHKLWKHTLVLVGAALEAGGTRSHLYHPGHFHGYRRPERQARRTLLEHDRTLAADHAEIGDHAISERAPGDRTEVMVIGVDGGPPPAAAIAAIGTASLVIGGARHLEHVAALLPSAARVVTLGPLEPALAALAECEGSAVVLASGDPGWFGIVRVLRERGIEPRVLPAPSAVAQLAARCGIPWDGVATVSAHGRDVRTAVNTARALPRVAVLTGPDLTPADLGRALDGWHRDLVVGERLGHDDERVVRCSAAEAAAREWAEPNVVLVTDPTRPETPVRVHDQPAAAPDGGWALPENAFEHRDAMVTKAEVRALVVARLAPSLGRLVWDVGAGSGSVGIECARLGAAVVAIDRDAAACVQVAANAERHGVCVRVVPGEAPAAFEELPVPDAAFVGGGGQDVLAAVAGLGVPTVVAAYAALDHAVAARSALVAGGYEVDGVQLAASRLATLPDGAARLAALNPVTVLWARAGGGDPRELHDRRGLHDRGEGGGE